MRPPLTPAHAPAVPRPPRSAPHGPALGPAPAGGWPDPAKHLPQPPNNHLIYALTWYGFAITLVVIFFVWARKGLRA